MNNTKAIFLDIDGVLNSYGKDSKSKCENYAGVDKNKVKRLAEIVQKTNAILVLTSTWKVGWEKTTNKINKPIASYHVKYLNNHLKKKGNLIITDKTKERNLACRGMGIKAYLVEHPEIINWVVLDDEIFEDFSKYNILPHLIKINPEYGLTKKDADAAITMLNNL